MFAETQTNSPYLAAVFPHWPIQRFLTENPHMQSVPVVLYGKVGRRQVVVGCNRLACKFGARVGLPMVQLSRKLAGFSIRHSVADDQRRLIELAMVFRQFTPHVGIQSNRWDFPDGDTILLDVSRSASLFGSVENIKAAIANVCSGLDLQVCISEGPTIASAWASARFGKGSIDQGDSQQNLEWIHFLSELPIVSLRVSEKNIQNLRSLGIKKVGQLMQLPQASLPSRFGHELISRIGEFWGQRSESVHVISSVPPDIWKHSLEYPTGDAEVLHAIIVALIRKVLSPIESRQQGVMSLTVHLFCRRKPLFPDQKDLSYNPPKDKEELAESSVEESEAPLEFSLELVRPTLDADYLYSLLSVSLERMRLIRPVTDVQVFVGRTATYKQKQKYLFQANGGANDLESIRLYGEVATSKLVDRLVCRLGKKAVVQAASSRQAIPERSYRWQTPLKKRNTGRRYNDLPASDRSSDQRVAARLEQPARLFKNPVPLVVEQSVYQNIRPTGDHRFCVPGSFQIKKKDFQLVSAAGPWQVDSLWWEGKFVHRKYYRVTTDQGLRFLIFQSTDNGCWFLHGDFA